MIKNFATICYTYIIYIIFISIKFTPFISPTTLSVAQIKNKAKIILALFYKNFSLNPLPFTSFISFTEINALLSYLVAISFILGISLDNTTQ